MDSLEDQLVSELWARDVRFLMGRQVSSTPLLAPAKLIASLAQSQNARVRLSLIPLLLRHPEFSSEVKKADKSLLAQPSQLVLRFYYTAATILQRKYWDRLGKLFGRQTQLPDLFSQKLGVLLSENPDEALTNLAQRHQVLSGQAINWHGTYEHAAERLIKHMEKFK
ncbi:MAG: hypothetical protein HYZ22_12300 [Chloroflexi bacterium]|nr:hypothetical protein [Chloroflexota bacterium]